MIPHYSERTLMRDLRDQGFTIEKTHNGYRILAPDGERTTSLHSSTLKKSAGRAYSNFMAQLQRLGFEVPIDGRTKRMATTETVSIEQVIEEVYHLVTSHPGELRGFYARELDIAGEDVGEALRRLRDTGAVRSEGQTKSMRYYPTLQEVEQPVEVQDSLDDAEVVQMPEPIADDQASESDLLDRAIAQLREAREEVRVGYEKLDDAALALKVLAETAAAQNIELKEKLAKMQAWFEQGMEVL